MQIKFKAASTSVRGGGGGDEHANDDVNANDEVPLLASTTTSRNTGKRNILQKLVSVSYRPHPEDRSFMERLQSQSNQDGVQVQVAVLSSTESRRYFGRALARRGIQPVYLEVTNAGATPLFLDGVRLDPNYFTALEAASVCHFWSIRQLVAALGVTALVFVPLLLLLPFKFLSARRANQEMNQFFGEQNFPRGFIAGSSRGHHPNNHHQNDSPSSDTTTTTSTTSNTAKGFLFCSLEDGLKNVKVKLLGEDTSHEFDFMVPVPGIAVDYEGKKDFLARYPPAEQLSVARNDWPTLKRHLENLPRATTNAKGSRDGDPANMVVIGEFDTILGAFGAHWDETEIVSLATCYKTAKSFVLGSPYKYSPVSPLYLFGRSQDFALQRARATISARLHLRLWMTPLRYDGQPVWCGQISRDIGVKLAPTWNLTTHVVDPNVDDARDYLLAYLLESRYAERVGLVGGVGAASVDAPRKNLGNDPYYTDGQRAVIQLSRTKTNAKLLRWQE